MDARHFDTFARALSEAGTRRGLLGLLTTLPLLGGLAALLDRDETDAKGRRKRRKKAHKHGKGRDKGKKKKQQCKPHAKTKTCAGTCGSVKNNCKKVVDCGSCDCPAPCAPCLICQSGPNTPGACVPDPEQVGDACGESGQVCQADGSCACQTGSCANPTPICAGGVCVPCSESQPCAAACCNANGACAGGGQSIACGFPGETCRDCAARGEVCSDRTCRCDSGVTCADSGCCPNASDVCAADDQCCAPIDPCSGDACGMTADNCGQSVNCGPCPPPQITTFSAMPVTIDRGASQTAELSWSTTTATNCSIDNSVGDVPCTGTTNVGPSATTTYTLTATGPGGGPVTAQASVTVQYCHSVNPSGITCPNAPVYCRSEPISPTNPEHAKAACETCFGAGNCTQSEFYQTWRAIVSPAGATADYAYGYRTTGGFWCQQYLREPGEITDQYECRRGRWA